MKKYKMEKGLDGKRYKCATAEFIRYTIKQVEFTPQLIKRLKANKGLPDVLPGKNKTKVAILCAAMASGVMERFKREVK